MKSGYIDYKETGYFSSTVISYLNQDPQLTPFIAYPPTIEGFGQIIREKKVTANRQILVETLKKQYSRICSGNPEQAQLTTPNLQPVFTNIELLAEPDTYTITTGHQLNLFTGPLYFLFKIVTAINLAKELKTAFPDKNFVPVYWMASEDHDFAEINHVKIHGKTISWYEPASGATGRISTKTILNTVKSYLQSLGIFEYTERLSSIVETAYLKHSNLADATRYLVNSLFAEYGLVIIDADDRELKKQFTSVIEKDILEENSFRNITQTSKELEQAGFKTQVNAREINFFYLTDSIRERIVKEKDQYYVLNTDLKFTPAELAEEIKNFPEKFSPNVVMRPLYQEIILPNLAYIGGGAELVYWLQLKKNFEFYGVTFPVLILRNSALISSEKIHQKLSRLNLDYTDIFKNTEEVQKNWVRQHSQHTLSLNAELEKLAAVFSEIKQKAEKIDPTLAPSAEAVKARLETALQNLEKKLLKAEKRNHSEALDQIQAIRDKIFPSGSLQERADNFGPFYVKYGPDLIRQLILTFRPLDFKFTILEP